MAKTSRTRGLFLIAILSWAVITSILQWYDSRNHSTASAAEKKAKANPLFTGTASCVRCHNEKEPLKDEVFPPVCRCTELPIWASKDKHGDAYKVLKSDRAKHMGRLLDIRDVASDPSCVRCHGVYVALRDKAKLEDKTFKIEEGVSCVVCHGAYDEWIDMHGSNVARKRQQWRELSREKKEDDFGMTDLWEPSKRAVLCASCHIGNHKEGKVVTHAMYAAGHPPLPSLEIATFSDAMPRHWQYIKEKDSKTRSLLKFKPADVPFEKTKLVLVSSVVAFRESLNLLSSQAAEARERKQAWPELAQLDCYACHHDLKSKSWRQERGYQGKPGRPQMRPWPTVLVKMSIRHLGGEEKQLNKHLKALSAAFDTQPFGKPQEVSAAARQVASWSDQLIKNLAAKEITRPTALALLRSFCTIPKDTIPDYDSARQLAWAARIIYHELANEPAPKPANHAKIQEVFQAIDKDLKLKLPSGKEVSIVEQLPEGLQKISSYDPFPFKNNIAALLKLLPEK